MRNRENPLEEAVKTALEKLEYLESETIIRYYFMGCSYKEIGEFFNVRSEIIRRKKISGIRKLKYILTPFVERYFGIEVERSTSCPLCRDNRLDKMILGMAPYGPWGKVFRKGRKLKITGLKSVSTIISHYKNHLTIRS